MASRGNERRRLERAFDSLLAQPHQKFSHMFQDQDGRPLFVMRVERFAVVYWLDVFAKEIRIVSIETVH
jgi:hypothetical protein